MRERERHPLRLRGPLHRAVLHRPPRVRGPTHHLPHQHPPSLPGVLSGPRTAPFSGSHVRTGFSFKEAILAPRPFISGHTPCSIPRPPISDPALPLHPPKFLLNPSLKGRCFRCFERGHRAARCREPRRCLLCMRIGHPASTCKFQRDPMRQALEPGLSSDRPSTIASFLPSRLPPPGLPSLVGRVALVETRGPTSSNVKEVLSRGLAARFGRNGREYLVANFQASASAVFFPSWVTRESAISRSPLRFEGIDFFLSNWVEAGEIERGHLAHKTWIRLHNWPILCWNEEDIKAAVSGFGELWDVDPLSERKEDVSFFRVCVRCQNVHCIPEAMVLTVDDRRFRIPIEIESWELANPILSSGELDVHLGLDSTETLRAQSGYNADPASRTAWRNSEHRLSVPAGQPAPRRRSSPEHGGLTSKEGSISNSKFPSPLPHPLPYQIADTAASIGASGVGGLQCPPSGPLVPRPETLVVPSSSCCPPVLLTSPCLGSKVKGKPASASSCLGSKGKGKAVLGPILPNPRSSELVVSLDPVSRPDEHPYPHHEPSCLGGLVNAAIDLPQADSSLVGPNFHLDGLPPGQPSPLASSPILRHPPSLDSSLSTIDGQPILRTGPMGANCSAPAKLFPSRRSSRLAAKGRGSKKSALQRAQEIMCKKIKMVRFAVKNVRTPSSRSVTPPPASDPPAPDPPLPESEPSPPFPPELSDGPTLTTPSSRDPGFPLTPGEIQHILATCGVLNNVARSPTTVRFELEVGEHSGGV